jgi:hypothetical protein
MTFKPGHPRYGGMQKGQVVSIKREAFERLRTVAMDAAGDVGYDGDGMNGVRGWLKKQAEQRPEAYLAFLAKILPLSLVIEAKTQINNFFGGDYETVADVREALEEQGIEIDQVLIPDARDVKSR